MTSVDQSVQAALLAHYDIDGTLTRLPGERDLNFRVARADGTSVVAKLLHAHSAPAEVELQEAVLRHLARSPAAGAAPRLVPTRSGASATAITIDGEERILRVLSWLEGRAWAESGPHGDGALDALGRRVAEIDRALVGFDHPHARRMFRWNLLDAPAARELAPLVAGDKRELVELVLDRYGALVAPRLGALPQQVIHNDANEHNILVDAAGGVVGLIDFGDAIWSARVCGLAVACAYTAQGTADPVAAMTAVVRGYDSTLALLPAELEVLLDLVRTRLALSICMSASQYTEQPDNAYLLISQTGVWDVLQRLEEEHPDLAHFRFRAACGWDADPSSRAIRRHLLSSAARPVLEIDPRVTIGRYGEERDDGVHLGVDLFADAGRPVHAPLDATVVASAGTVLLEHRTELDRPFWTLWRHLSGTSAERLSPGDRLAAGDEIGRIGSTEEDGGSPPHLHLQLFTNLVGRTTDLPGVAAREERDLWRSLCPDPNLILGLPAGAQARQERAAPDIVHRRSANLSRALSVSYAEPLHIVRGRGARLIDVSGRSWLDLVNNVAHVGHCHPRVVAAAERQIGLLNTNTRYLHSSIVEYAGELVSELPDPLRVIFFVNSGSEANDLALRLARAHTGRRDVLVLDHAYHGHLSSLIDISPYKFNGRGGAGRPDTTHVCDAPDPYRGRLPPGPDLGVRYADGVGATLAALAERGRAPAAFFVEPLQSCGGQIVPPPGYLAEAFRHVRDAGGLCVADEVQIGFGRVGRAMWGFELQDVVPDIVTMGKPIGNGHPLAAVATTPEIAASFAGGMEYFNTFGGNPVSCEIGLAVLDVLRDERLQARAHAVGTSLIGDLRELARRHELIGDVRGEGLFIGVELTADRESREPATAAARLVKEALKSRGVLISTDGPDDNVLKIKPPLVIEDRDVALFLEALDLALTEVSDPRTSPS